MTEAASHSLDLTGLSAVSLIAMSEGEARQRSAILRSVKEANLFLIAPATWTVYHRQTANGLRTIFNLSCSSHVKPSPAMNDSKNNCYGWGDYRTAWSCSALRKSWLSARKSKGNYKEARKQSIYRANCYLAIAELVIYFPCRFRLNRPLFIFRIASIYLQT